MVFRRGNTEYFPARFGLYNFVLTIDVRFRAMTVFLRGRASFYTKFERGIHSACDFGNP